MPYKLKLIHFQRDMRHSSLSHSYLFHSFFSLRTCIVHRSNTGFTGLRLSFNFICEHSTNTHASESTVCAAYNFILILIFCCSLPNITYFLSKFIEKCSHHYGVNVSRHIVLMSLFYGNKNSINISSFT